MESETSAASDTITAHALASAATRRPRLRWLDCARGLGILLVVYAHAARALPHVLPRPDIFRWIDTVIYSFHMPLFFLLAGVVSVRALDRSRKRYLSSKFVTVVYPYFLWSAVYWLLETMFSREVNSPIAPDAILEILWRPIEHLWFLYALFLCQVITAILWPSRALLVILSLWIFFGPLPAVTVPGLWTGFPWFTAGLIFAPAVTSSTLGRRWQASSALVFAGAFGALALALSVGAVWMRLNGFLIAGVGIMITLALSILVQTNRLIAYLGEASLSIYLLHTIFSAGVREISEAFYPVDPLVLLAITVVTGICGPLTVHELARRGRVAQYLGLGRLASASGGTRVTRHRLTS